MFDVVEVVFVFWQTAPPPKLEPELERITSYTQLAEPGLAGAAQLNAVAEEKAGFRTSLGVPHSWLLESSQSF